MHKRNLTWMAGLAIVLGFAISAVPARAQETGGQEGQGRQERRRMMSPEEQLDRMAKDLNLTDDQKAEIKPILEERREKMQKLFTDDSVAPEDRRSKMREIFEASNKKIRDVLNDEQKKKFDDQQARRRERMEKREAPDSH